MLRLRFRHRIGLMVALAGGALAVVAVVTLVLGRRNQRELLGIETRYVPLIELDRDLKTTFGRIPHALQDAASADDETRLEEADSLEQTLLQRIESGGETIRGNGT